MPNNLNTSSSTTRPERKIIAGGLEIRPLGWIDALLLILLLLFSGITRILSAYCPCKSQFGIAGSLGISMVIISGLIGARFRSVYFSALWFLFSLLLIDIQRPYTFAILSVFILYHMARLHFYKTHGYEFVPYFFGRGKMEIYSRTEQRKSGAEDLPYNTFLFIIGFVVIIMLFIASGQQTQPLPCGLCG